MESNQLPPIFRRNEILAISEDGYEQMLRTMAAGKRMREMPEPRARGTVAVIPIHGPILYFDSWLGVNTVRVGDTIEAAADSARVSRIVLDIDSPGGTSYLTQELSDRILAAGQKKPIEAIANPLAASAAYWIGSAAHRFYITPSGDGGSLGTYQMHVDYSKALEKDGVNVTFVHAGKNKVEWSPYHPLKKETIDYAQKEVNAVNDMFMTDVARNRGVSKAVVTGESWGQGRTLIAKRAVAVGMFDGIRTLSSLVASPSSQSVRRSTSMVREKEITDLLRDAWHNGYSGNFTPMSDIVRDIVVSQRRDQELVTEFQRTFSPKSSSK